MADEFSVVRRNISFFLFSLKQSIDRSFRFRSDVSEKQRSAYLRPALFVEEARLVFNSYVRFSHEPSASDWALARKELIQFSENFLLSDEVDDSILRRPFFGAPLSRVDRENPSDFIKIFWNDPDERAASSSKTILEALVIFQDYLRSKALDYATAQGELTFSQLSRIVPAQQVAPVRFEIRDLKIYAVARRNEVSPDDQSNVDAAREHLEASGLDLIANLERLNCDPRLVASAKNLHSQITEQTNIIKVGLSSLSFHEMARQFDCELPDAVNAIITSYCASASLYVAQFPEWEQFTQNAASIQLDIEDVEDVENTAQQVIEILDSNIGLSDPEVPKTIAAIREMMNNPGKSAKRAAFAMIRTIENLVSSVFHFGVEFVSKSSEKFIDSGSTVASKTVVALLSVALVGATGIGNAALNAGAPWVNQAAEIVKRELGKLEP